MFGPVDSAEKEVHFGACAHDSEPGLHGRARLFGDLKLDGTASLPLYDSGPTANGPVEGDVPDPEPHQVAASQLAIDRQIE